MHTARLRTRGDDGLQADRRSCILHGKHPSIKVELLLTSSLIGPSESSAQSSEWQPSALERSRRSKGRRSPGTLPDSSFRIRFRRVTRRWSRSACMKSRVKSMRTGHCIDNVHDRQRRHDYFLSRLNRFQKHQVESSPRHRMAVIHDSGLRRSIMFLLGPFRSGCFGVKPATCRDKD